MSDHSLFPPSSMHRLVHCTGSHALSRIYPERDDAPEAMEGTAAHWVCLELLSGRRVQVGTLAPNSIAVTDEMIEGAEMYVESFPPEVMAPGGSLVAERRVDITSIDPQCWGTPDAWYIRDNVVAVHDYKFGHGYVDVFENYQLAAYAAGVLDAHPHFKNSDLKIEFVIVQPRNYHKDGPVRRLRLTLPELWRLVERMSKACTEVQWGSPVCTVGAHCEYCPAAHACQALQQSSQIVFDFTSTPIPSDMSPEAKGLYLKRLRQAMTILDAMEKGLAEEIEAGIRNGMRVPGWSLEPGAGRLSWSRPIEEVAVLGDMLGVDLRKPGLITPTQAKTALKKKGIDESVISGYSAVASGGLKLVQSDTSLTRRIFGSN